MPQILIIDDEQLFRSLLRRHFAGREWDVAEADTGEAGLLLTEKLSPDVILLDLRLPDMDGMDVLIKLKSRGCRSSIVIMTGWGNISNAVEIIKLGAEQYLTKPVRLEELDSALDKILETRKLRLENLFYRQKVDHPVVGVSIEIQKLHRLIDLMAENADTTVMLLGESGTGKELVAGEIHKRSSRRERPFLDINCAALSETLIESEIFGHERGAFTDAREAKPGLLEVADGGTVFLDEIAEMPLSLQPKLLRVLETRSFKRVGGTRDIHVNVRIIAATNADLEGAVDAKIFREDLYYRLNVFPIHMPALRERHQDIPTLAAYFVQQLNAALRKGVTGFTTEAIDQLKKYSWPGNVRELRNVVERAMVLTKGDVIDADVLPQDIRAARNAEQGDRRGEDALSQKTLADMEKEYILRVFNAEGKNATATARLLGISRSTLHEKLKRYGIK